MEVKLLNGSMTGSQDEKGNWVYKATNISPFKGNGNLKKVYHDLPRFKVITQYEKKEQEDYAKSLDTSVRDISLKLLSFLRH